jgi:hypothetical protein
MPNPRLQIYRRVDGTSSFTKIIENDSWVENYNSQYQVHLAKLASDVGAFTLTSNNDAAVMLYLQPGEYTANVTDASGVGGDVLLEVYAADPF